MLTWVQCMQSLLKAMNRDLQGLWIARLARDPLLVYGLLLPVWCVGACTYSIFNDLVIKWMTVIYSLVWRTGVAPMDWQRAIIVPVHKKNNRRKCGNYRGISLLGIPGKVFAKILNDRVRCLTENRLLEEQTGFRSGRG